MTGKGGVRHLLADLDGTLVTDDKQLTAAASAAVRDLRRAGVAFAITSGAKTSFGRVRPQGSPSAPCSWRLNLPPIESDALNGDIPISALGEKDVAASHIAGLTSCQREIMTLVLAGHPNKNIAVDLGISRRTVETIARRS
jgi:Bacterial regulatory proteins, luxR family/haloacid dehalogenase-like hydrolase